MTGLKGFCDGISQAWGSSLRRCLLSSGALRTCQLSAPTTPAQVYQGQLATLCGPDRVARPLLTARLSEARRGLPCTELKRA